MGSQPRVGILANMNMDVDEEEDPKPQPHLTATTEPAAGAGTSAAVEGGRGSPDFTPQNYPGVVGDSVPDLRMDGPPSAVREQRGE